MNYFVEIKYYNMAIKYTESFDYHFNLYFIDVNKIKLI